MKVMLKCFRIFILRIMIIAKLVWNLISTVVDIETAFLHGNLDEEICKEVPMGLSVSPNKKLILRMER